MNKNQELFGSSNNYLYLCKTQTAEIAQLVEHDLAKVGVAGPSPVFRSFSKGNIHINEFIFKIF